MTQPILGIDLGTTNSAVAIIDEFDQPKILVNSASESTTPSVVFFESADSIIVGKEAKNVSRVQPDDTEELIKRAMGDQRTFTHFGTAHTPESISALILKSLVTEAFESLQLTPVDPVQAVITVPAYFGIQEKEATHNAAKIAGIEVIDLIPEPVAAALAYGARYGSEPKTIFVYDLGGGTFDTTILVVRPDQLEVLVVDGHHRLGGADLDQALLAHVLTEFKSQANPDLDPEDDDQFLQGLALDIEEAKKSLSAKQSVNLALSFAGSSLRLELTRDTLEELTASFIASTMEIVDRTLDAGRLKDPNLRIDEVLLVGGSSKMPIIKHKLEEKLGVTPVSYEPDLSVAKGAAVYATLVPADQRERVSEVDGDVDPDIVRRVPSLRGGTDAGSARVINVLPRALGIVTVNTDVTPWVEEITWLVPGQSRLPVDTIKETFGLASDNTQSVQLRLFEQSTQVLSTRLEDNKEITPDGGATIVGLPNLPAGSPIEVEIDVNHEGLFNLSAYEPQTAQRLTIPVQIRGLDQQQMEDLTHVVSGIRTN